VAGNDQKANLDACLRDLLDHAFAGRRVAVVERRNIDDWNNFERHHRAPPDGFTMAQRSPLAARQDLTIENSR
jgi:hypothetical protein